MFSSKECHIKFIIEKNKKGKENGDKDDDILQLFTRGARGYCHFILALELSRQKYENKQFIDLQKLAQIHYKN